MTLRELLNRLDINTNPDYLDLELAFVYDKYTEFPVRSVGVDLADKVMELSSDVCLR